MAGVIQFTSSQWIQSGSYADFKNGISVIGDVDVNSTIVGTFTGDGSGLSNVTPGGSGISLYVGSASGTPPQFEEWVTGSGAPFVAHSVRIQASSSGGHLNHYTFIENKNGEWSVVSSGSNNGLVEQNYYDTELLDTGIYRYLVLGHSTASKVTLVEGTTVTINPELL